MSTADRKRYALTEKNAQWLGALVATSPIGYTVTIEPPRRSLDQNAIFHALCDDIAKAKPEWSGLRMDSERWKALLVVSHAIAIRDDGDNGTIELVPDLEGQGLVQLRESTARMSKVRSTSLIEYTTAWAAQHGVALRAKEPPTEEVT